MPKMRVRRIGQIVVGQRCEYSIDRVAPSREIRSRITSIGRSGLTKPCDHGKSNHHCTSEPPAGHRPRFPCSPIAISATRLSAIVRKGGQSLPAAPAGRLCVLGADDVSNHRVHAVRTDQQISFGRAAVFELDPHPVLRTDHLDRWELYRMRSVGKPSSSRSSRTRRGTIRTGAPSRSTIAVRSKVTSRPTGGCHDPHGGQQLTGPVHVDAQLPQNRRAVGPDGDGSAACLRIRPLFEDGDVMSVPQQSTSNGNAAHAGADDEDSQPPSRS